MSKHGKKYNKVVEQMVRGDVLSVDQALAKLKEFAYVKFDESVDVDVNLGIDPSKGEQVVRGSVVLPHGRGKTIKVLVFAKGDYADQARAAGADYVGAEDLIEKISGGWMDFNYAVATPDMMGIVGKVARVLGPRGLLPNKKLGTVTTEISKVVGDLKKGQAFFRNDKSGIVHFSIGKVSFDVNALRENLLAFVKALQAAKPSSAKGKYIKKMSLSSTMGVGIPVGSEELLRS